MPFAIGDIIACEKGKPGQPGYMYDIYRIARKKRGNENLITPDSVNIRLKQGWRITVIGQAGPEPKTALLGHEDDSTWTLAIEDTLGWKRLDSDGQLTPVPFDEPIEDYVILPHGYRAVSTCPWVPQKLVDKAQRWEDAMGTAVDGAEILSEILKNVRKYRDGDH